MLSALIVLVGLDQGCGLKWIGEVIVVLKTASFVVASPAWKLQWDTIAPLFSASYDPIWTCLKHLISEVSRRYSSQLPPFDVESNASILSPSWKTEIFESLPTAHVHNVTVKAGMQTEVNWKLYFDAALSLTSSARASLHRSSCFPLPALILEQDTKTPPLVAAKRTCPLHRFPGLRLILIPAVPHVAASSVQAEGHYRTTSSTKRRNGLAQAPSAPRYT